MRRVILALAIGAAVVLTPVAAPRYIRVNRAAVAIPVYSGAKDGARFVRYWPRVLAWDDSSSARVDRLFSFSHPVSLIEIARHADGILTAQGWYRVSPEQLRAGMMEPQVVVWQRDPDERLDLMQVWPIAWMTREQRLYGNKFPAELLDAPQVISWIWALGGSRSPRPGPPSRSIVRMPGPPPRQ